VQNLIIINDNLLFINSIVNRKRNHVSEIILSALLYINNIWLYFKIL